MGEPIASPRPPVPALDPGTTPAIKQPQQFSSSPGFGTPSYPIHSRPAPALRQAFAQKTNNTPTAGSVLSLLLPPQTLRPIAFRTLTKKHNLTLTSSGLSLLSTFIGRSCGSSWREDGLAERVLDEFAKAWKNQGGGVLVEDGPEKRLSSILKTLEPCMSGGRIDVGKLSRTNSKVGSLSRQNSLIMRPEVSREDSQASLGMSGLEVEDADIEDDGGATNQDARAFLRVIPAFKQPRLTYSISKKTIETLSGQPSLLPPIKQKIALFRDRYNTIHQRLLRNESFQNPSYATNRPASLTSSGSSSMTLQQSYKITPISNLLGRSGSDHLLLGMLSTTAAGDLAISDPSGSVVLDITWAHEVPKDSLWFAPGMMILVDGSYEEDGSNNSTLGGLGGVGGQIKGRFVADTFVSPPAEKRDVTLGIGQSLSSDHVQTSVGAGFGWVDFLGTGSEKAVGSQMRKLQQRILDSRGEEDQEARRGKVVMMAECHLDSPRTIDAIRAILNSYISTGDEADRPLAVLFMGNFVSAASMAGSTKGGGSIEYKEHFDALASMLSEFPQMLSSTTFIFVPGDNDPWASSFSSGAATILPRQGVPELFTSRIRRAFAAANQEAGKKNDDTPGEAIWTSNPSRISLFGPLEEIVLFRDDVSGRLRRNSITFPKRETEEDQEADPPSQPDNEAMDASISAAASHLPNTTTPTPSHDEATARKLIKTLLDQSHLSPFPLSLRPLLWDYSSSLSLYPLPTALVLADAEAPAFCLTYEGCHVMNPGKVLDELGRRKGLARWVEYDVKRRRGERRDVRF